MPINVNDPEYVKAEKEYHESKTEEERLIALNKMISHVPRHKGAENLRQQLTQRRKRFEEEIEKKKKKGKGTKSGIKKGEMQAVIVGKTNSGKSSLLKIMTNAKPKANAVPFSTDTPVVGIMNYENSQIQLIEIPSIESENFEKGIVHTADTLILLINSLEDIEKIKEKLPSHQGSEIIALNKSDLLNLDEKRKLESKMQSKKYNFVIISCLPNIKENGIEELKKRIFNSFKILRVFTKEPGKEKSKSPMILPPGSTVKEVAEKILKGFSKKVMETKIWGPSSKFPGQIVGLNHQLKDLDVVEFKTR